MISVVVPTYNEAGNIPEFLDRINSSLRDYDSEVVVVDDNSPDGTSEVAREYSEQNGYSTDVIVREKERGLCGAVLRGVEEAKHDIICVMDADLQHPPEKIPDLVQKIEEGYDVVVGSRYVEGGEASFAAFRKMVSRGASYLARAFLPVSGVKDPMSGFFAAKKETFPSDVKHGSGFKVLLEVLCSNDVEVVEVPISFAERKEGESNLSWKGAVQYLRRLVSLI
ncbi:MAG: polyprenol monophosphomannose synthase [Candidatus Aenigmatarchaeota archaeon]